MFMFKLDKLLNGYIWVLNRFIYLDCKIIYTNICIYLLNYVGGIYWIDSIMWGVSCYSLYLVWIFLIIFLYVFWKWIIERCFISL